MLFYSLDLLLTYEELKPPITKNTFWGQTNLLLTYEELKQ